MHCCRFFSPTLPPSPSSHPPPLPPSSLSSHPPSLPPSMCALCVHSCVGRVTKIDDYEIVQIRLPRHIAADHVRHTHTQVHLVHNPHTRTHTLHATVCVQCCGTYVCMPTTHVLCTYVRLLHMSCVRMYACYTFPVYVCTPATHFLCMYVRLLHISCVCMYACYTCPVYVCTPATHFLCTYVRLLHISCVCMYACYTCPFSSQIVRPYSHFFASGKAFFMVCSLEHLFAYCVG